MRAGMLSRLLSLALVVMAPACGGDRAPVARADEPEENSEPAVRLELSIAERRLYVFRDGLLDRVYPIAVGQDEYPTPTGEFTIHRVDWNPDWTPPEGEWAEGRSYTTPGHPDNPMGRVRLLYSPPYSLHGTEELESLGRAASHGSVRLANSDIIELAKLLMEVGGEPRDEAWFEKVLANPTEMEQVELPNPVPLRNRKGAVEQRPVSSAPA